MRAVCGTAVNVEVGATACTAGRTGGLPMGASVLAGRAVGTSVRVGSCVGGRTVGETRGVGGGVLVLIVTPTGARAIGASAALASAQDTTSTEMMARFKNVCFEQ